MNKYTVKVLNYVDGTKQYESLFEVFWFTASLRTPTVTVITVQLDSLNLLSMINTTGYLQEHETTF
jgi:hypothetical protein